MKYLAILLLLTGCATTQDLKVVKVPLPIKCHIEPIQPPHLYFSEAKVTDSLYDKIKLLLAERLEMQAFAKELVTALNACTE